MTAVTDLDPVRRRLRRPRPPRLRLLADPQSATAVRSGAIGRGVFVAVTGALVLLGMALLLILNTTLAQGAFDLQQLRAEYGGLQVTEQQLAQQVEQAQSPQELRDEAVRLGMVPVQVPAFLRLSDGAVLGDPVPARARVHREGKLARGAAGTATDAATPERTTTDAATDAGTDAATDAATPSRSGAATAGGTEAAEDQAAREARRAERGQHGDAAVPGPEGAEEQAAPRGGAGGTGRG